MEFLAHLDEALFVFLTAKPDTAVLLNIFGVFCAKFLIYMIPLHLVVLWFCGKVIDRRAALAILLAAGLALLLGYGISLFYFRLRPFMAGLGESLIQHKASASFPSSHSIIFAAYVYVLYFYRYKQVLLTALLACFFMGWGRVFVGVHYPFDIFGGFVLGASISWLVVRVATPWIPAFIYNVPPLKKP